ncbi:hypothetical protein BTR14_14155 [Rhizobium rhizosphaerae]|uniref:TonB C-terminal domain-containing protein n=1 Tax=Xaviernesmea rhizosphaerae TaxID=1672749 RepID=A0ABX3PCA8_9HYPH|nr:energy transducer TonB [Xaviernesmea rhizosphaerae]OQP85623.1 hypothetical protein BTR14_14155 [Xaviernesmea rhizosphaerae]
MSKTLRWTVGIGLSLGLHAVAGAVMLLPAPEAPDMAEGGPAVEVATLGNAFADTLQAGTPSEVLSPSETPTETAAIDPVTPTEPLQEAVPPETVESESPPEVTPDPAAQAEAAVSPDTPVPSANADVILPQESLPPPAQTPPEVVAALPPVEHVVPLEKPEPPKVAPAKPAVAKKAEPKPEKPRRVRPAAGEGGKAAASARKGAADGEETASAAATSAGGAGQSSAAGQVAASRYKSIVQMRLQRVTRYPSEAQRARLKGTAVVSFVVGRDGSVLRLSIKSSSGAPVLDQAALDAVRRVKLPALPEALGQSFTITAPMDFTR